MPQPTPNKIVKAAIQEMVETGKDSDFAKSKMVELWEDAYPAVAYLDDKDVIRKRKERTTKKRPTATDALRAEIGFDELWGGDINDQTAYAGLAMQTAADDADEELEPIELYAHLAEGLTRKALDRTGFKEHGGLVLTFLKPLLDLYETTLRKGSHIYFRAQRYRIVEMTEMVTWGETKENLFCVVNCLVD